MKIKFSCLLFFAIYAVYCISTAFAYEEINTSHGKVITGISREESLDKFGAPVSASDDLWLYNTPEMFFVYFSGPSPVYLYPKFCSVSVGIPLELKAFTYSSGFKIKDISNEIVLLPSEPRHFILRPKESVVIPKKAGEYQILGKYGTIFSNPVYLTVREAQNKEEEKKEKLLGIDIVPHRPKTSPGNPIIFMALGTFYDSEKNKYAVKDISQLAEWFLGQGRAFNSTRENKIFFDSAGAFRVFCRYDGIESPPQDIDIKEGPRESRALKHITLLPEFVIIPSGGRIDFGAFGTYYDNRIEDISALADWESKDREILAMKWRGSFNGMSEGVTEVVVKSDKVVSLPAKVIITGKQEGTAGLYEPREPRERPKGLMEDVENLRKNILSPGKRLKNIQIIPEYLRISVGMEGEFTARGFYDDGSEEDLTKIGKWASSSDEIAKIILGKASALSVGECNIHIEFHGMRSAPARLSIEGSKLLSIIVSPQNSKISMRDRIEFKAQGYFSDSSQKDITPLVSWNISGPRIVKIEPGFVRPLKFGHTSVFAEYSGIKSLPADIAIIFTIDWLIYSVLKAIALIILALLAVFFVLYTAVLKEKQRLLSLRRDKPGEFIIGLYENLKKILGIFGLGQKEPLAPLLYAGLVEERLGIGNKLFLSLTERFEEAKYSRHTLHPEDASSALDTYNGVVKILVAKFDKFTLFLRYCAILLNRKPLLFSSK
jgi:hypothetical protein